MTEKPVRFLTVWNMNFGFLGIQFGWALQMANMSLRREESRHAVPAAAARAS